MRTVKLIKLDDRYAEQEEKPINRNEVVDFVFPEGKHIQCLARQENTCKPCLFWGPPCRLAKMFCINYHGRQSVTFIPMDKIMEDLL